jgi:hypothetical protein
MYYTKNRSINLDFNSPDDVGKYNLALGTGAYIDKQGLHKSASKSLLGTELDSDELTLTIKMSGITPVEIGTFRYLFDTTSTSRIYALFNSVGDFSLVGSTAWADYQDYWNTDGENEFVACFKNAAQRLYLNGTLINTGFTGFSGLTPSDFYLLSAYTGGLNLNGVIKEFNIYKTYWNHEDVVAYFNNSLFNFKNQALTWLDFRSEKLDGSTRYLIDKNGKGNDFAMVGDPTFQNPVGYLLDTNDSFTNTSPSAAYTDLTEYTVVIQTKPLFPLDEAQNNHLWGESNTVSSIYRSSSAARLRFHFNSIVIAFYVPSQLAGVWNDKSTNIIIYSVKSGKNNIWINGHHILVDGTAAFATPFTMTSMSLCSQVGGLYSWDGTTYHMSDYPFAMGNLHAQQLTYDLLTSKN